MNERIFGTDCIRGTAGVSPIRPDTIIKIAQAAGRSFLRSADFSRVVIGRDTRSSCCMVESALVSGFTSVGMDVALAGTVPTAAVGMLTRSLRADLGVMISASQNPHDQNGIKFFGPDGFKLGTAEDAVIERSLYSGGLPDPHRFGQTTRLEGAVQRYMAIVRQSVPSALRLDGLKIVVDAANGAAFRAAPELFWELGSEVVEVGTKPDGRNINLRCGTTDTAACRQAVLDQGADIGIALDGDAGRVQLIDEKGRSIDGDQLLALIADGAILNQSLRNGALVSTIMSNVGLERHLSARNVGLVRTDVGDRHVVETMRELGCNVGGDQSGHVILSDFTTTGDGLIAALRALAAMVETGRPASETLARFTPLPQIRRNIHIDRAARALDRPDVQNAISEARSTLSAAGRIVVRASGTEPLIRILLEGEDEARLRSLTDELCRAISRKDVVDEKYMSWAAEIEACGLPERPRTAARLPQEIN